MDAVDALSAELASGGVGLLNGGMDKLGGPERPVSVIQTATSEKLRPGPPEPPEPGEGMSSR
ncbi:hypothetical protein, partial [Arthrobacter sp. AL12]|uniref:hypothetical protein n=1 Tax=Arthrobacter sp. AL12 TaxID=3042241 RepID=UPI00249B7D2A